MTAVPHPDITPPTLLTDDEIWFSAYGFGWGYCAFALPVDKAGEHLSAGDASPKQLLLAFQLGKRKIVQALQKAEIPHTGDRVVLNLSA
ncbi:MAG: hypothetical protein WDN30_10715 [Pararobbsia sp.]